LVPKNPNPGAHAAENVPAEHRDIITRISKMLQSRIKFRLQIEAIWRKVVGLSSTLDFSELPRFLEQVARKLDVPVNAFDDLQFVFMYDFTGDGALQFKEAYTLVKDKLASYRKSLGGHPVIDVPNKTLEEAGYTIVKVLASGGQGTATLATDRNNEFKVVKVYLKGQANAASIDDIKEEMENMKKAQHPNLAVCHEIFQDARHLYMVSDPYMGGDLESLQQKAREHEVELTEEWYKWIFHQAFTGLDYLHRSCVVHCDIKEPNIMVKRQSYEFPEIVIIDLGLAGTLQPNRGTCGTPGYMPPETWDYGAWFPTGDVFSMGVVCVQMLTDNVPNSVKNKVGIFQKAQGIPEIVHLTKTRSAPFEDMNPYSDGIMQWLPACLAKDFRERPKPAEVLQSSWFENDDSDMRCDQRLVSCCPDLPWLARPP